MKFDWETFDPKAEKSTHDALPAGEYVAVITDSKMKPNRAGTGEYLELSFQVAEGVHQGRFIWTRLNLVHENEQAVRIARGELAAVCKAVGVLRPSDSSELHDKPLKIVVRPARDEPGRSEIKSFRPLKAAPLSETVPPAAAQPVESPKPAAASVPPWKRKAS